MLANAAKLVLVTAAVALFATSADAQNVHPRCAHVKDKVMRVKCTCFLANGGLVEHTPSGKRAVLWTMGQLDGYIACLKRHGLSLT